MKRYLFILFIGCCISSGFSPDGSDPLWLKGTWKGTGLQLNTHTSWSIKMTADPIAGTYKIEYPSLNCGGHWELVQADNHRAEFRERITEGYLRCANNGILIITKVTPNHISFTYFANYDGSLEAHSTLERVAEPGT